MKLFYNKAWQLAFEELVTFIAPRFKVLGHRFHKTPLAVMINMLLTEGETRFESLLHHTYEYLAGPIRRRRLIWGENITKTKKPINIHKLECVKLFSTIYPLETDFVKTELMQWMQNSDTIITPSLLAAKFLWLCRTNNIPVMLREISRDFGVRTRNIVQTLSETEYIPPLCFRIYQ